MTVWSIIALFLAVLFLVYRQIPMSWNPVLAWLFPASLSSNEVKDGIESSSDGHHYRDAKQTDITAPHDPETIDGENTPKAGPITETIEFPALSLNEGHTTTPDVCASAPLLLPPTNVQRVSPKPQPSNPASTPTTASGTGLMPPPARPAKLQKPTTSSAEPSLRVPSTGPLPNRGPPAKSQQRVNGGLAASGVVPVPNPRGKVVLSPGHSPLDWAALTRSDKCLSGVSTFQRVTPSQLRKMTGRKGKPAWSSFSGKVYNITPYLPFHPGGEAELMKAAGRDGTKLFMDVHPWVNWDNMLGSCLVGVMVPEETVLQSSLEEMD